MAGFLPDTEIPSVLPPLKAWRVVMHKNPADGACSFIVRFVDLLESPTGLSLTSFLRATVNSLDNVNPSLHNRLTLGFASDTTTTNALSQAGTVLSTFLGSASGGWFDAPDNVDSQWLALLTDLIDEIPNVLTIRVGTLGGTVVAPYLFDVQYWDLNSSAWVTDWSVDTPQTGWTSVETRTFYRPGYTP